MARPVATKPLSEAVRVRLNQEEKQAFEKYAKSLDERPSRVMRRLIREAVSGGPDYFDDGLTAIRETNRQLLAIGRNLNQLTKLAHKEEALVPSDLVPELEAVRAEVAAVAQHYGDAVARARQRRIERVVED